MQERSPLHEARLQDPIPVPALFEEGPNALSIERREDVDTTLTQEVASFFPHLGEGVVYDLKKGEEKQGKPLRVGFVFSGGQAPGGHNVAAGLFDALQQIHSESKLIGFLGGPSGLVDNEARTITRRLIDAYRNQGGFDLIGSGRTKIESPEQFVAVARTAKEHRLDALVIIGGDDSNTNAALLAEYFLAQGENTTVIGVPKTIDGDLKQGLVECSFGFDTACKLYSELIGNIARDALSARKYYHFIKLMGRAASHITLECALQTRPNMALISEEVAAEKHTLKDVVDALCDVIAMRSTKGKEFGVILVPEGLIEFIPEFRRLIRELNELLASGAEHAEHLASLGEEERLQEVQERLRSPSRACFSLLPRRIQEQLLLDRDPHGNVQVSRIDTEQLLIDMVKEELCHRKEKGLYQGNFSAQHHFLGYEGRAGLPSNFDCHYSYALGFTAAALIQQKCTGYMSCVYNLTAPVRDWRPAGMPLVAMMDVERRHGKEKPVIRKALVDLEGAPFQTWAKYRSQWALQEAYLFPGPLQFYGSEELCNTSSWTLRLEQRSQRYASRKEVHGTAR